MLYKGSFLSSLHALARWLMGWNVFQFGGKKLQNWNVWRMSAQVFLSQNVVQHIWKEKNKVNLQAQKIKVSSNDVSTKSLGSISQQLPFWKIHMEPENDHLEKQTSISKFQPLVLHGVTWLVLHKEWGKETSNRSFPNRGGVILYRFHQPAALLLLSVVSAAQQDMDTRILERRQRAAGARNSFKDEDW